MWEDPIVAEVRRIREQLSAQFGFDVKAIFADIRKRESAHADRLVVQRKQAEDIRPARRPGLCVSLSEM